MSLRKGGFARISAIILVALFCLVFISLIIGSKAILPDAIRSYIKEVSKDTGYKIEIKKIEFDFFYGLKVEEIGIFDPLSPANPILRVRNIAAKPDILSSLINWKIRVEEITIDNPIFSVTEEELNKLIKLTKEKEEERKKERPSLIEVEHLTITGSRIEFPSQILIRSKKIEIDLGDANLGKERKVRLSGSINLQNREIEIHGEIKPFLDTPIGELKMNLSDLNTQSFSNAIRLPERLNIFLDSKFQVSDKITSQGVIDFRSIKSDGERMPPFSGKLEYDLAYDSSTDTAMFDSLNLDVNDLIHISFAGRIEKLREEAIFKLEGGVETIRLEKILRWFPSLSQIEFSGDAKPNRIKIIGSRKDKSISLTGKVTLREFNIKDEKGGFQIKGLEGVFDFEQNFGSRVTEGFFAQGDFFLKNFWIETLNVNKVSGNIQFIPSENGITFRSKGLYYKNLSFSKALVESGSVSRLEFNLGKNSDWTLNVSSDGSQFKIPGEEVYIRQFQTDIHIRKNEGMDVWGNLRGKKGRYKDTSFPILSTDFRFYNNLLKLTNLKVAVETYGELRTEKLGLTLQKPYTLTFTQGSFSGFNQGVKSRGIEGEFRFKDINRNKPMWDGDVSIREADIFKSQLKNLSLHINPSSDGVRLEKISGRFLGGDLGGSVWIKTIGSPSLISSDIEFRKAVLPLSNIPISLGRVNFKFTGELRKGLLPQGTGEIEINRLKLGQDSMVHPLRGRMEIQTTGETAILKNGFIEDEKGVTVKFIGRIENSLNTSRGIQFDLPESPVASIQEILFPILPGVLREGKVSGNISLNLVLHPTESRIPWDGKLSLKDASFDGKLSSGVHFLVKDINGAIHLVEDINALENPLSLIRGYSKPDKETFKASLEAITQSRIGQSEDILNIKEIEYGFLRLENIEFALELGRNRLNLRRFESGLYGGNVFGTGLFEFGGKEHKYDLSFLVKDISLKEVSNSIPSAKDYITGRINGIGWLSDRGEKLSTLNGSFNLWAIKSKEEPRTIGRALLTQLGVKERFLLRSSRKYDKGEVYGYIKDGVITFKELEISHSIFGIKDLLIQVDSKRNSISVPHFLSVIRETAKRASEGRLKIEIK